LLKLIFHDRTFKAGDDANSQQSLFGDDDANSQQLLLGSYATKIQSALRSYLQAKHARVAALTPKRMTCPITLSLLENPVVASDGNTYEYDCINRLLTSVARFPTTGPLGVPLLNKSLVANLSMRSEVMEFRELHKLVIPKVLAIPALQGPVHAPAPRAPPAPRQYFQPQVSMAAISQMRPFPTLSELFKIDGFSIASRWLVSTCYSAISPVTIEHILLIE
jgi:hypothetical protein